MGRPRDEERTAWEGVEFHRVQARSQGDIRGSIPGSASDAREKHDASRPRIRRVDPDHAAMVGVPRPDEPPWATGYRERQVESVLRNQGTRGEGQAGYGP